MFLVAAIVASLDFDRVYRVPTFTDWPCQLFHYVLALKLCIAHVASTTSHSLQINVGTRMLPGMLFLHSHLRSDHNSRLVVIAGNYGGR